MKYPISSLPKKRWRKIAVVATIVVLVLGGASVIAVRHFYSDNLRAVSGNHKRIIVTIPLGATAKTVAKQLKDDGLIRSSWAFEQYIRNHGLAESIKAGTYALQPSQSVAEIINTITEGKVKTDLVTIIPGSRLDQIKKTFTEDGFTASDVDQALQPAQYKDYPALVDKPAGASLEGYLYPESFQKTATTTPTDIVRQSLDQMQKHLTADVRAGMVTQNLTVHQGVILASIVEQEVSNPADKAQVAQVFLKRLRSGMPLGSDVTIIYGAIVAGQSPSLTYDSAYNTHVHPGLPAGPISNVSESSLQAVIHPADTDWLYFVTGDDGVTYFSKTFEEHQALVNQHCKKLCP